MAWLPKNEEQAREEGEQLAERFADLDEGIASLQARMCFETGEMMDERSADQLERVRDVGEAFRDIDADALRRSDPVVAQALSAWEDLCCEDDEPDGPDSR